MFAIAGIAAVAGGIVLPILAAAWLVMRIARVRRRIAALPSHPFLETEWRARQELTVRNLSANLRVLRVEFESLSTSIAKIVVAVKALDRTGRVTAVATEDILTVGVPWLRGLFAKKM